MYYTQHDYNRTQAVCHAVPSGTNPQNLSSCGVQVGEERADTTFAPLSIKRIEARVVGAIKEKTRMKVYVTQDRLKELLNYNSETGIFTWKVNRGGRKIGSIAGAKSLGYRNIMIDKISYQAHRLAWLFVYGKWPEKDLDHINLERDDNRICNLRVVSDSENKQNQKMYKTNTSGFKGVSWCKNRKKWIASICINYKTIPLGKFDDPKEASLAYLEGAKKYHKYNLVVA